MKKWKEDKREQRRSLIVRCARKCFFRFGLKGATMESIARECRLAKGTLYLYFSGKEDLYASLLEEGQRLLNQAVEAAVMKATGDIEQQLLDIAATYHRFAENNREYFQIIMMFDYDLLSSRVSSEKLEHIHALQAEGCRTIEGLISEGMAKGLFPPDTDVAMAVRSSWAMLHGGIFLTEKRMQNLPLLMDLDEKTFNSALMQIMLRSLKAGFITYPQVR
jgi:AcrR family transcriptional regulator